MSTLPKASELSYLKDEICNGREFSEEGYIQLLNNAIDRFKLAFTFEASVEVYNLLLPLYRHQRDYTNQAQCYEKMHQLCDAIIAQQKTRLPPLYYRVMFNTPKDLLEEIGNKEYIYKAEGSIRIAEFTDTLKARFGSKLGPDKVHVVSSLGDYDKSKMEEGNIYLQIISVTPYFSDEESLKRATLYEKKF